MWQARRWSWVMLCAAAWLVLPPAGTAQGAEPAAKDRESAKELFRAGRAAYERGDFRAAAASFEEAARLAPHPQAWYAAGEAWDAARAAPRAVYAFEQALELPGLPARKTAQARRRLERLTRSLGEVRIEGPTEAAVALAHVRRAPLPTRIHVEPGEYEVRLIEPAAAAEAKRVVVTAGQTSTVVFELPAAAPAPAPPPSSPPPPPAPAEGGVSGMAMAGWTLFGIGVGGSVAAAAVTSQGLQARDEWEADRRDEALLDRAESLRTWSTVAWVAAGAVLGTGVTLLVIDAASADDRAASDEAAAAPGGAVQLGPAGVGVVGRW